MALQLSRFKLFLSLSIVLALLIFTLQNSQAITIKLFLWQATMSRALVIFIVFSLGILLGYSLGSKRKTK